MRNTEPKQSRFRDGKPINEMMPTEKFHDLINQAHELGYRGVVGFQYYSEPTCDPRLVSLVRYVRKKGMLPEITSNGVLLTGKLCKQLDGLVDKVEIGLAGKKPRSHWLARFPKTRKVVVAAKGYNPSAWWPAHFMPQKNRVQAAVRKYVNGPCHRPRKFLLIQYNGEMSLCCEDLSCNFNLGSAFEKTLEELWWSEKHIGILKTLSVAGGRLKYPHCRTCPLGPDINIRTNYKEYYAGTHYLHDRPGYGG